MITDYLRRMGKIILNVHENVRAIPLKKQEGGK